MAGGRQDAWRQATVIAFIILSLEVALLVSPGTGDRNRWLLYMDLARTHGFGSLYSTAVNRGVSNGSPELDLFRGDHFKNLTAVIGGVQTDYPPLGIVILGALSKIADAVSLTDFIMVKIAISAFMLACAGVAACWRGHWRPIFGLSVFVVLVPDGLMLSYIDPVFLLFLLLAVSFFDRGKPAWGVLLYTISCLVKWQPVILAPFVLLFVLPRRFRATDFAPLLPGIVVMLAAYAIFGNDMIRAFTRGAGEDHLSSLGLNLNWLYTAFIEIQTRGRPDIVIDSLPGIDHYPLVQYGSRFLALLVYFGALLKFYCSSRSILAFLETCIVAFLGYCIFYVNVHENHLLLVAVLGLFWAFLDRTRVLDAVMLSLMLGLNMYMFFGAAGHSYEFPRILGMDVTIYMALLNVAYSTWLIWDRLIFHFNSSRNQDHACDDAREKLMN